MGELGDPEFIAKLVANSAFLHDPYSCQREELQELLRTGSPAMDQQGVNGRYEKVEFGDMPRWAKSPSWEESTNGMPSYKKLRPVDCFGGAHAKKEIRSKYYKEDIGGYYWIYYNAIDGEWTIGDPELNVFYYLTSEDIAPTGEWK